MIQIDLANVSEDVKRLNPELGQASMLNGAEQKPRKWHNNPTVYNGREYQSEGEANHASELDLRKKAGDIIAWFPQVWIDVGAGIYYVADFVVIEKDWSVTVEDYKSKATRKDKTYRLKRKMFKAKFGRDIVEVLGG